MKLLPITIQGNQFYQKQKKQYELFAALWNVIFEAWQIQEYINVGALEKDIARRNSQARREARLTKKGVFKVEEHALASQADTLALFANYIEKKKIARNEYFKKAIQEKYPEFVTLEKLEPVLLNTVIGGQEPFTFLYSTYVPSGGLSGRIPIEIRGKIRTVNTEMYEIAPSDSLTFSVSSLTDLLEPDRHPDIPGYQKGVALLKEGQFKEAWSHLSGYKDSNVVIALLSQKRNTEAWNLLEELEPTAVNLYLLAVTASRLGQEKSACEKFLEACALDPSKKWRGNLDPEISYLIKKYELDKEEDDYNL